VLCPNERVVEKARLLLGQDEDPSSAVGESLKRDSSVTRAMRHELRKFALTGLRFGCALCAYWTAKTSIALDPKRLASYIA
jgi:hypothetical protein